jgi:hypothetical protein
LGGGADKQYARPQVLDEVSQIALKTMPDLVGGFTAAFTRQAAAS